MRFTTVQYESAIRALQLGATQLEPDGENCHICGDSGHQASECGRNPLYAMLMCKSIAEQAGRLHEQLHALSGFLMHMGEPVGPSKVILPDELIPSDPEMVSDAESWRSIVNKGIAAFDPDAGVERNVVRLFDHGDASVGIGPSEYWQIQSEIPSRKGDHA